MRNVVFSSTDFELFDTDITPQDYEFFQKHKGAFKALLEDQTQRQKQKFVDAFREFSINHGCMKDFPIKSDNVLQYVDEVIQYFTENFVYGKVSKAKCLVMDAVCLAQNRGLIQHVGSSSYAKDPFVHKDTRDVFRRLFGQPTEQDACLKAMCVLPLYVKFGGSICRYLRRWLEAGRLDELGVTSLTAIPLSALLKSKSTSTNTGSDQTTPTTPLSTGRALQSEAAASSSTMVAVATVGGLNGGPPGKASSSDDDDDEDEEEDNWHTKVIRGIQSVLTDRAGPSPIEYMEVYKRDKDGSYRRLREDFHLGKPHPNQEFEERLKKKEEERIEGSRLHEAILKDYSESQSQSKRRQCANCRKVEKERGVYKKCERCKGKGTKFYCSRKCQSEDWVSRHREDHSVELPS